jgi:hypothetical protein
MFPRAATSTTWTRARTPAARCLAAPTSTARCGSPLLTPGGLAFANIPAWNANWRAAALRSYKSFLIALNVTKAGVNFPSLVKWSDVAPNNVAPTTWDETDTTKLAGENPLSQAGRPSSMAAP